jgi:beta-lactamase regulating signal transducer with metallopeptidase domain/protocatechuate 3,4-dioxygenase beta subunit
VSQAIEELGLWLADVYVLTTILLALVWPFLHFVRDPARRLSLARGSVYALAVLVVVASIPGLPRIAIRPLAAAAQRSNTGTVDFRLVDSEPPIDPNRVSGRDRVEDLGNNASDPDARDATAGMSREASREVPGSSARISAAWRWSGSSVTLVSYIYLAGLVVTLIWLLLGAIQAESLRRATSEPNDRVLTILTRLAGPATSQPCVRLSSRIGLPVAIGLVRPMIVLPHRFAETENDARLAAALVHEWAHLRNGDLRLLALLRWLKPVLYAHPDYWWLRRLVRSDQEVLADAAAASVTESGRLGYAETLLAWARFAHCSASGASAFAALGIWERPSLLQLRIRFLTDPRFAVATSCSRRWRWAVGLIPPLVSVALSTLTLRSSLAGASPSPQRGTNPASAEAKETKASEESILYASRVVDPTGNPVAGAKVYVSTHISISEKTPPRPVVRATTGPDGSFDFGILKTEYGAPWTLEPWRESPLIAMAPGFGPAVTLSFSRRNEAPLNLARDDVPIEGRILDLGGQPVAGAKVQVVVLLWPRTGDLSEWSKALRERKVAYQVQREHLDEWGDRAVSDMFPEVETSRDGWFTIKGVGRERVVSLLIRGPLIETKIVNVVTAPFETIHVPDFAQGAMSRPITYYGPRFEHVAGPTRIVTGTVRDKDTGKPLAGAVVKDMRRLNKQDRYISTTTDKEGNYRLVGLTRRRPGGRQPEMIVAIGAEDQPYLPCTLPIADRSDTPRATPPVTVNFNLKRGIWIRGRVTDLATGKPPPAIVSYFALTTNPSVKEAPDFRFATDENRIACDRDGNYRLVGLPGRGLVAARAASLQDDDRYRFGVGVDRIAGLSSRPGIDTVSTVPFMVSVKNFHTLTEVNAPEGAGDVVCNVQLDPGRTVKGKIVGPDGAPLTGCQVSGLADYYTRWEALKGDTSEFEVQALAANDTRYVLFLHVPHKLAGNAVVRPEATGPTTVKLEPWGSLSGRIVDADGEPMKGLAITCRERLPRADPPAGSLPNDLIKVADDGRFQAEGLVPGLKYIFSVTRGGRALGMVGRDIVLQSGETRNLGDVKIEFPRRGN